MALLNVKLCSMSLNRYIVSDASPTVFRNYFVVKKLWNQIRDKISLNGEITLASLNDHMNVLGSTFRS
jgi:hypothetical protein